MSERLETGILVTFLIVEAIVRAIAMLVVSVAYFAAIPLARFASVGYSLWKGGRNVKVENTAMVLRKDRDQTD